MFFVIPTSKVSVGDIIIRKINNDESEALCVLDPNAGDNHTITVLNYENSDVRQIKPERHIFLGNAFFYGKVVSMFGNIFGKEKGVANIMKFMMMSKIFGGDNSTKCIGDGYSLEKRNQDQGMFGMGNMGQLMAMSMFMGGKENPFSEMFNFDLNLDSITNEDEDEETEEDTEEVIEVEEKPKKTKKTKKN